MYTAEVYDKDMNHLGDKRFASYSEARRYKLSHSGYYVTILHYPHFVIEEDLCQNKE